MIHKRRIRAVATLALVLTLVAASCGGDDDSSDDTSSPTTTAAATATTAAVADDTTTTEATAAPMEDITLTVLVDNAVSDPLMAALAAAYTELHPNVTFDIELRPGGGDGDNIVKTRLATGEMADIFSHNSGSLLAALSPAETLVDIANEPFMDNVAASFIPAVSDGDMVFGVPFGTGMGGGILYNKAVFAANGLTVPTSWDEFAANNETLLAAGVAPVGASFADTWTSQLFVLADYYNVEQAEPTFAADYTANAAKYASTPAALTSFDRLQEGFDKGWWQEDFGSATFDDAQRMLLAGEIAQYPMLSFALGGMAELDPVAVQDIGFFAQPGPDSATNGLTLWLPNALYIPQSSEHIDEAKSFLAFVASVAGTEAMTEGAAPAGPYLIKGSSLPADVLPAVLDIQAYLDADAAGPALEFLSPIKGPQLEQITVEVGSGLRSAADAAALYDQDVEKQAKQLGLPGW